MFHFSAQLIWKSGILIKRLESASKINFILQHWGILACRFIWGRFVFFNRAAQERLRLTGTDSRFGFLQRGTFVHTAFNLCIYEVAILVTIVTMFLIFHLCINSLVYICIKSYEMTECDHVHAVYNRIGSQSNLNEVKRVVAFDTPTSSHHVVALIANERSMKL